MRSDMIKTTKTQVIFSRKTWEELKSDDYYRELIEAIIDREDLAKAIDETDEVLDFKEYDIQRRSKLHV